MKTVYARIREHKLTLLFLGLILFFVAFFTYQFISVEGIFSDLKNDLKEIELEGEGAYLNLAGEPVSLGSFKGTVLVINSWATWTPFSKDELRTLGELQAAFGAQVSVLAVNRKEQLPLIRAYLETQSLNPNALVYLSDPTDHFYTVSGGHAMPETIVYAKDGTIQAHYRGTFNRSELEGLLQTLIE